MFVVALSVITAKQFTRGKNKRTAVHAQRPGGATEAVSEAPPG